MQPPRRPAVASRGDHDVNHAFLLDEDVRQVLELRRPSLEPPKAAELAGFRHGDAPGRRQPPGRNRCHGMKADHAPRLRPGRALEREGRRIGRGSLSACALRPPPA